MISLETSPTVIKTEIVLFGTGKSGRWWSLSSNNFGLSKENKMTSGSFMILGTDALPLLRISLEIYRIPGIQVICFQTWPGLRMHNPLHFLEHSSNDCE